MSLGNGDFKVSDGGWLSLLSSASESQTHHHNAAPQQQQQQQQQPGPGVGVPMSNGYQQTLTALAKLEGSLTCFICKRLYQSPVSVSPCQHNFCSDCLSSAWAQAISTNSYMLCPICDTPLDGNLESFPRNRGLEETVEIYRTLQPLLQNLMAETLKPPMKSQMFKTIKDDGFSVTRDSQEKHAVAARASWDEYFNRLVEFRNEYGHTRVRYQNDGNLEFKRFADWVRNQRYLLAKRKEEEGDQMADIYVERIQRLTSIGFDWAGSAITTTNEPSHSHPLGATAAIDAFPTTNDDDTDERNKKNKTVNSMKWDIMYERLSKYYQDNGTTVVSDRKDADSKRLHDWTRNQKYWLGKKLQEGRLSPVSSERVQKLDALNFPWRANKDSQEGDHFPSSTPRKSMGKPKSSKKQAPSLSAGNNNTAYLAETLGKVLGALDNLGALENSGGKQSLLSNSRKRLAAAAISIGGNAEEKKRTKLERKLERISSQLTDAEQNFARFHGIDDIDMATQAKTRMVDLYNKKVEIEQELVALVDLEEDEEDQLQQQVAASGKKKSRYKAALMAAKRKSPAEIKRGKLDRKLELVSQQLSEAEKNIARFQTIRETNMAEQAKTRMAKLYHEKVAIENDLMALDDEEEDDNGTSGDVLF